MRLDLIHRYTVPAQAAAVCTMLRFFSTYNAVPHRRVLRCEIQ